MKDLFLFEGLTDQQREQILAMLESPVTYEKGDVIYGEQVRSAIGVLLEGKAECVAQGGVLMKVFSKGEVFGAATIFGSAPVSRIRALGVCRVQYVDQQLLVMLFEQYPVIAENYIRFLSERVRFLNQKIALLSMDSVKSRLMEYLQSRADENGVVQAANMSQLAKTLGIGRTSLYRSLDELSELGWITREDDKILIKEKHV